jgi:hypothetical protein
MFIFSKAFPLMQKGYRIRSKRWPELYFITLVDNKIFDSNGNLFVNNFEEHLKLQSETADAAGHIWEIYYEVADENL